MCIRDRSLTTVGSCLFFGGHGQVYRLDVSNDQLDSMPENDLFKIFPISRDTVIISKWDLKSYWYDFGRNESGQACSFHGKKYSQDFGQTFSDRITGRSFHLPAIQQGYRGDEFVLQRKTCVFQCCLLYTSPS